jgi:CRISPR-associated protein Cas8b1/Cst1 subtype I-B
MLERILEYYYENYSIISDEEVEKYLKNSLRTVKNLLHNRLTESEYLKNCTDDEREKINYSVCELAEFNFTNKDKLNFIFKNYKLGDLSFTVEINSLAAKEYMGVVIPNTVLSELSSLRHFARSQYWRR